MIDAKVNKIRDTLDKVETISVIGGYTSLVVGITVFMGTFLWMVMSSL